jgi:hypothetical protein
MALEPYRRDRSSLFGTSLYMLIGPLLWGAHMTVAYSMHTLFCTLGMDQPVLWGLSPSDITIAAATTVAVAILAVFVLARRLAAGILQVPAPDVPVRRFLDGVMLWLGLLSAAGIVWGGSTFLLLASCAQLR